MYLKEPLKGNEKEMRIEWSECLRDQIRERVDPEKSESSVISLTEQVTGYEGYEISFTLRSLQTTLKREFLKIGESGGKI